jgi:hypothetical protein
MLSKPGGPIPRAFAGLPPILPRVDTSQLLRICDHRLESRHLIQVQKRWFAASSTPNKLVAQYCPP